MLATLSLFHYIYPYKYVKLIGLLFNIMSQLFLIGDDVGWGGGITKNGNSTSNFLTLLFI